MMCITSKHFSRYAVDNQKYFCSYISISQTFILLFQMATSAGWDGTLNAIFDDTDCKLPDSEIGETGK